jgi:formiminotetrahydrofolate cyclodeaminase
LTVDAFLGQSLDRLLDEVASEKPAPGAGSAAALVVAMGAGLAAMAARLSLGTWEGAADLIERADALRRRVAPLAPADGQAYEEVLTALRLPRSLEPVVRDAAIANALARAAEIPLEIAGEGAYAAGLAAEVAEHGNPNLRSDAAAGAVLASAAAQVAANLVAINLGMSEDDERVVEARTQAAKAEAAAGRALAAAQRS